ncbi:ATP-dependent DNA helicase RecG [Bombilactobacillus thymidiniphilus]|uniref:ATP-dependent DNA helicase RecG n=1 Tax=Bombilactobacillus thymidiniphilus TaxID=2923363 RepID=A0ABY4PD66_9LACO|nr:ATP-dependent DNA helicase RecG [Bombilactobacillus thymidiniphilus]UQS83467.1 ATP-dependent DNA helicase RecG [Bombilactobacillus thymidiniphilus]
MQAIGQSVIHLNGVGPKLQSALAELGIITVRDLLYYFPRRYEDLVIKSTKEANDQEKIVLQGVIASPAILKRLGNKRTLTIMRLLVDNQSIPVTFFNQPWLKQKVTAGQEILIYGQWNLAKQSLTGIKILANDNLTGASVDAIYPTNKKVPQKTLIKLIKQAIDLSLTEVVDPLPVVLQQKYQLLKEQNIIKWMHFPENLEQARLARRSAKFREFFLYSARLCQLKNAKTSDLGVSEQYNEEYVQQLMSSLDFSLTAAQQRALTEILRDMAQSKPMNRLLQGDVGSGKTIVAAIAMFAAVTAGFQAVLMVPTEILAQQHFKKLAPLLAKFQVTTTLLTSSLTAKQRKQRLAAIQAGRYNCIIGTQALFQKDVQYAQLGLVVIDEQHRFGVQQRKALRQKGINPDLLLMTATPIPRTLAITYYGEMDLSLIDELPQGRQQITTFWLRFNKLGQVKHFLREQLVQKAQVFVVAPLIADSSKIDLANAQDIYQKLVDLFPNQKVGLLHGQMTTIEKEQIMTAFQKQEIAILVATTVIEVGIDVPNASIMVVLNAERFGLSQLHQLRGRVGRGQRASYCILVSDPTNKIALQRMKIMTQTTDGFRLAQKDLELRGSGDFFGDNQSGLPAFKIGDPVADAKMLDIAYQEARHLFQSDQKLMDYPILKSYISNTQTNNID